MRYRWNRYTGKWLNRDGDEKRHVSQPVRATTFLKRWLRCARDGDSLQFFMRDYPWLTRGACQKRMRRMRTKLADEQGILLPMLEWDRPAASHTPQQDTEAWAKVYRSMMTTPPEPPDLTLPDLVPPQREVRVQRAVRTADHRSRTITRDPLLYRSGR